MLGVNFIRCPRGLRLRWDANRNTTRAGIRRLVFLNVFGHYTIDALIFGVHLVQYK